eukprot:gene16891-biopygen18831
MRGRRRAARAPPGLVRPQRRNSKSAHVPTMWPLDDTTMLGIHNIFELRATRQRGVLSGKLSGRIAKERNNESPQPVVANLHANPDDVGNIYTDQSVMGNHVLKALLCDGQRECTTSSAGPPQAQTGYSQ